MSLGGGGRAGATRRKRWICPKIRRLYVAQVVENGWRLGHVKRQKISSPAKAHAIVSSQTVETSMRLALLVVNSKRSQVHNYRFVFYLVSSFYFTKLSGKCRSPFTEYCKHVKKLPVHSPLDLWKDVNKTCSKYQGQFLTNDVDISTFVQTKCVNSGWPRTF